MYAFCHKFMRIMYNTQSLMILSAPVANYVPYVITGSPMFIFVSSAVFDIPLHFVLRSFLTHHCLPPLSHVQEI